MLDTAAVAELVYDHFLARSTRALLDRIASGDGHRFFAWLCGVHDWGKTTPAFMRIDKQAAAAAQAAGLSWPVSVTAETTGRWRHDKAGGKLAHALLPRLGWPVEQVAWVWPLLAGHHGTVPHAHVLASPAASGAGHGKGAAWQAVQRHIVEVYTAALGYGAVSAVAPKAVPSRAEQLAFLGAVIMCDWIASDAQDFPGLGSLAAVSWQGSRDRAAAAWARWRLSGGWQQLTPASPAVVWSRFGEGFAPRPSQNLALEMVAEMTGPGLVVIEAPMGEGKTETGLACTELLASRFGAHGVMVGMPTQATADPMYTRVRRWMREIQPGSENQAVLLHGKRAFNPEWIAVLNGQAGAWDGIAEDDPGCCDRTAPSEWVLGRHRGLIAPTVVGTIDQILYAATRTRHVMLRHLGLVGKVVLLDEVHAADVYMSAFLEEALRWLGQAGVPVILMSATLPPAQRQALMSAYLAGLTGHSDYAAPEVTPGGYPCVTTATTDASGTATISTRHTTPWRTTPLAVQIGTLSEPAARRGAPDAHYETPVRNLLQQQLADGGTALIIRNTVTRAQRTYRFLRATYPRHEIRILHGQLTAHTRAIRSARILDQLGPSPRHGRPHRLIIVATAVAEQSFDIDADLLVTDICPTDLLAQRIGRLHRHAHTPRPEHLRVPACYVTAYTADPLDSNAVPAFEYVAEQYIYDPWRLQRTASNIHTTPTWLIPHQVPDLVATAYSATPTVPTGWATAHTAATALHQAEQQRRTLAAQPYLLAQGSTAEAPTLAGLHYAATDTAEEEHLAALVRDGDTSIEAVLLVSDGTTYWTLGGTPLGLAGLPTTPAALEQLTGSTMRLPVKLTADASALISLPAWANHPLLRTMRALVLNPALAASLGPWTLTYHHDHGLSATR